MHVVALVRPRQLRPHTRRAAELLSVERPKIAVISFLRQSQTSARRDVYYACHCASLLCPRLHLYTARSNSSIACILASIAPIATSRRMPCGHELTTSNRYSSHALSLNIPCSFPIQNRIRVNRPWFCHLAFQLVRLSVQLSIRANPGWGRFRHSDGRRLGWFEGEGCFYDFRA